MNTPSPLIPQGSLQSKGRSNLQLAVASIVAIHIVFFGGLLLQGCKPEVKVADSTTTLPVESNTIPTADYNLGPLDTNTLYYNNSTNLPADASTAGIGTTAPGTVQDTTTATLTTSSTLTPPAAPVGESKQYVAVKGDNYTKIAKAHGITISELTKANPKVVPSKMKVGQKLEIPAPQPKALQAQANIDDASSYTVKAGDTLTKIAKKHGTTVSALRAANGMKVSMLKVGQKIKLPASGASAPVPGAGATAAAPNTGLGFGTTNQ